MNVPVPDKKKRTQRREIAPDVFLAVEAALLKIRARMDRIQSHLRCGVAVDEVKMERWKVADQAHRVACDAVTAWREKHRKVRAQIEAERESRRTAR